MVALAASAWAQGGETVWAPKRASKYTPPHKPHTKLADVRARHAGQSDWREVVVYDELLQAEYISSEPGSKTPRQFHPDTRTWWVVLDGQLRYEIEGQEPFVATKGSIVQAPMQTIFRMETLGDKPAIRFEVNIAKAKTLYPGDAEPPKMPGFDWIQVRLTRKPGAWTATHPSNRNEYANKPHVTFAELAALGEKKNGTYRVVDDDRGCANFIYGYEKNLPPLDPNNRGHYHPEGSEFWVIMAGQIRYPIEGQDVVIASVGDVVYVPPFTWHAPRYYGPGPSCRLAMNGYPEIAHLFENK
jgi:quercetin dioxygenase-like cupin family protein